MKYLKFILYTLGAIIGYALFFTITVGTVALAFHIIKWIFN